MKKTGIIFLLVTTLACAGCATMEDLKTSITTTVTSITSNVDPALVAKVPDDKRAGFPKAEFAVRLGEEKLKLAQLKSELAAKERKSVDYDEDLVNTDLKEVSLEYDIVKMEAIDASGLGKKEDNIKALTGLKLKKNELQSDRIKINANKDATKRQIQDITEKIKAQEEKVKNFTMETAKPEKKAAPPEKDKAPEPPAAPAAPEPSAAPTAPGEKTK
jgi:nitrogen regulatory protein PII